MLDDRNIFTLLSVLRDLSGELPRVSAAEASEAVQIVARTLGARAGLLPSDVSQSFRTAEAICEGPFALAAPTAASSWGAVGAPFMFLTR